MKNYAKSNTFGRTALVAGLVLSISACTNTGKVTDGSANRAQVEDSANSDLTISTNVRATSFSAEDGVSTTATAEVLYRRYPAGGNMGVDAIERAQAASGCQHGYLDSTQKSLRGWHAVVLLTGCPPLTRG